MTSSKKRKNAALMEQLGYKPVAGKTKEVQDDIMSHLLYIGDTENKEQIMCYIDASDKKNLFNAYVIGDKKEIFDIRFPIKGAVFFTEKGYDTPLAILQKVYKDKENFELTKAIIKNTKISKLVNVRV